MRPDPPDFFPPPVVIPPLRPPHKNTFILLHGRGSNASTFGPTLLSTPFPLPCGTVSPSPSPDSSTPPPKPATTTTITTTLRELLPHTKFVFPTAARSRATIYKRSLITQWFDSWHINHEPPPPAALLPTTPTHIHSHSHPQAQLHPSPSPSPSPSSPEPTEATAGTAAAATARASAPERRALAESYRAIPGLRQTVAHVHAFIRAEARELRVSPAATTTTTTAAADAAGATVDGGDGSSSSCCCCRPNSGSATRDIVLGGLSQGCAAGLMALLLWDGNGDGDGNNNENENGLQGGEVREADDGGMGEMRRTRLGAFVGMCGWLPFGREVVGAVLNGDERKEDGADGDEAFDPFERDGEEEDEDGEEGTADVAAAVVKALKEKLEMEGEGRAPKSRPRVFDTPVFLGHGALDEKVHIGWGREAAGCLEKMGMHVSWNEYPSLGHWYSAEMLTDLAEFLRNRAGCETSEAIR
ncbi:hypothetical protein VTK26DRAFT_7470 [Humicola hyalothermophila]